MRILFVLMLLQIANLSQSYDVGVLDYVNKFRSLHSASNVTYSDTLSTFAQSWAENMASTGIFAHSGQTIQSNYGENLAFFYSASLNNATSYYIQAIDMWYSEEKNYDYSNPGFSSATGHFSQLVWASSNKIGYGIAQGNNNVYVAMEFTPPGNYNNDYSRNVFPKNIIPSPSPTKSPSPSPSPMKSPSPSFNNNTNPPNPILLGSSKKLIFNFATFLLSCYLYFAVYFMI